MAYESCLWHVPFFFLFMVYFIYKSRTIPLLLVYSYLNYFSLNKTAYRVNKTQKHIQYHSKYYDLYIVIKYFVKFTLGFLKQWMHYRNISIPSAIIFLPDSKSATTVNLSLSFPWPYSKPPFVIVISIWIWKMRAGKIYGVKNRLLSESIYF